MVPSFEVIIDVLPYTNNIEVVLSTKMVDKSEYCNITKLTAKLVHFLDCPFGSNHIRNLSF